MNKRHRYIYYFIFLFPLVFFLGVLGGCSKSGNIGFDPETDYIVDSIWAEYPIIVAGGRTDIYARIIGANSRKPLADVVVQFSTDTDTMENTTVLTNSNGIATSTFLSSVDSTEREAVITAKVTAEQIRTGNTTVTILPTNFTDPEYLYLTADPDTVYADGVTQVDLTARVLDETYSPLKDHQVHFEFLDGNLGDIILEVDNYAITGVDGKATAHFIAPNTSRVIVMQATVYGIDTTLAVIDSIWVLDMPDVDFIQLRADPTSIPADGVSECMLSAYVAVGSTGTPAPDGQEIIFTSDDGVLLPYIESAKGKGIVVKREPVGSTAEKGLERSGIEVARRSDYARQRERAAASLAAYTEDGYAVVRLRSSTTAHKVRCTASAVVTSGDTIMDSTYVEFTAGDPISIIVTAARSVINADGNDTTLISATVYDEYGNHVGSGHNVVFDTDKGAVFPTSMTTDTLGVATTVLTSGVVSGYARVTATCEGATGYTDVLFSSTIPKFIQLNGSPMQIVADGMSQSIITAEVLDSMYNPVTDGVRIHFMSSLGMLSNSREKPRQTRGKGKYLTEAMDTRTATTSGGYASVTLTSGYVADSCMVAAWYEMFDTIASDTVITATDTIYLVFLPGEPSRIEVSFSRDSILADGEDTATVWADVYDPYDNLVRAGYTVDFTPDVDGGTVSPTSDNTDANGRANTELTSSRDVGWHTITAAASGATPGSGDIYFYPIIPKEIRFLNEVDSAVANGADSVLLNAYITDDEDRPCSDGTPVYFSTGMGTFLPASRAALMAEESGHEKVYSRSGITNLTAPRGRIDPRITREEFGPSVELAPMADSFMVQTGSPFPPGIARLNLISPTVTGTTWVYVSVATSDTTWAYDSMQVVFVPDVPARIELTATPDTIAADSTSTSVISALVTDAHSNLIGPRVNVDFNMAAGAEIFGEVLPIADQTDSTSIAYTTFHSFYRSGEAIIEASLPDYPSVIENVSLWLLGSTAGDVILSTDSVRIHIGKTMNITANVYDSLGDPITDGTHVDFTVEPPEMGTVVPASPVTTAGEASSEFRPDTIAGSCVIIATVGSVADTKSVRILPGQIATIDLQVLPDTLPADGVSTANAVARCYDTYGNPAEEGSYVSFSTDLGSIDTVATTDTTGIAVATYTAGVTIGTANVQAVAGTAPIASATVELIGSEPRTLILTADSSHIAIDGKHLALTAYCLDGLGHPVSDGTRIDFSSIFGTFSSRFEFTSDGFAYTDLISGTVSGFDTVVASADSGAVADTLIIRFDADQAYYITLSANPDTIAADGRARSIITAYCTDSYSNPVSAGRQVEFTSEDGTVITPASTDSTGTATTEYIASDEIGTVRIDADLELAHAWTFIEQIATPAAFITVSASPNRVVANGVDSCSVLARVLNEYADPVPDGTIVHFRNMNLVDSMVVGDMDTFAATTDGEAEVWWRSPSFVCDAVVYGNVFGLQDSALVSFIAGEVAGISIDSIVPGDSIPADGETRANVFASVIDIYGNPVPGERVDFSSAPLGTFVFNYGNTDSLGQIDVQIYSDEAGVTTVMATSGGYTDYTEIYFTPVVAANIYLSADSVELIADGISTTIIHALVVDSASASVPDNTPIIFDTDLGFVFPGVGYTVGGEATTVLRSSTTIGTATITGDAGDSVIGTCDVDFVPGPPARIDLAALPASIPANGDTFTTIQALVYDRNDNLVEAGVRVNFTSTLGTIDTMGITNSLGEVTVRLYAGITPGTAVVWANSGDALAQVTVDFINTDAAFLYLYVDPPETTADGRSTAQITGSVTNDIGSPVSDGTPIILRVNPDSLGRVAPVTAHTDSGNFTSTFTSDVFIGRAYIVAEANPTVIESVSIDLVPGPPDSIAIWANPTSIPADSFSTSICTVIVFDRFRNPVGAGVSVGFDATLGTIDPTTETTNSLSRATATFTAGRDPGEARVRANSGTAHAETYITLENSEVRYITVTFDTSSIVADGLTSTFCRAYVTDSIGMPVTDGTPVYFNVDTITGNPDDTSMVYISPTMGFTNSGEAVVQVRGNTDTGRIWVQACTDSVNCGNAYLDLVPGPVDSIYAWADPETLVANGEDYSIIRAELYDRYGNSLAAGVEVTFGTSSGAILPNVSTTNSSGEVSSVLTAGYSPTIARVDVTCEGITEVVEVVFGISPPAYLSLRASPRRIDADGVSYSNITANVLNSMGQPVTDGTLVIFHSVDDTGFAFGEIETLAVTEYGQAEVQLYSETVTGVAHVSARTDGLSDTTEVTFTPGPPHHVEMEAIPNILYADGASICTVRTSVYDQFDNLVEAGELINFDVGPSPTIGSVFPEYTYTDDGAPSDINFRAGTEIGTAIIEGRTVSGPVGNAMVELIPLTVATIDLFADSLILTANGTNRTTLHAVALDSTGVAVSDSTPIYFSTSSGFLFPGVGYTGGGEALSQLRSGTQVDTAEVIAFVGTPGNPGYVADTAYIRFVPGEPYSIELIPDSTSLIADGESRSDVRAYVYDAYGNPVRGGVLVNFVTTLGTIDTVAVTVDTAGLAIAVFQSGITQGTAIITATSGSALEIARIDLLPSDVGEIFVIVDPGELIADGRSSAEVSGAVRNTLGNPISDGTPVSLEVIPDSLGDVTPRTAYTDSGEFVSTFTAGTITGGAWVVASVGSVADTATVDLEPGEPDSIEVIAVLGTIPADSFSVDTIRAYVLDEFGNSVGGGVTVSFTTSRGEVFPVSDETNSAGMVEVYLRSSFSAGVARVVARSGDARGEVEVLFTETNVSTISLTIDDNTLLADGFSETTCRATVLDSLGNPVSDGVPIQFTMWPDTIYDTLLDPGDTLGALIPSIGYTTGGQAVTTFRVFTKRGRVWIRAASGSVSDEVFIQIQPGNLSFIELETDPDTISANGRDESEVTATLFDEFRNRLLSGSSVSFGTDLGEILPGNTLTNSAGDAFATLTAGTEPGIARVWAQSSSVFELNEVVLRESEANFLLLAADPVELVADGMSQSIITCQVFDTDGSPISDGTTVEFDANPSEGVVVSPKLTLGGNCVTTFTASTDVGDGAVWVSARVIDGSDTLAIDSVKIFVVPGPPASIDVWADSSVVPLDTIPADGYSTIGIYARVLDQYGNHMEAGEAVTFQTSRGSIGASSITDTLGIARSILTAGLEPGDAIVEAHCTPASGYHQVYMDSTGVDMVVLLADTSELTANGISTTDLYAYVYAPGGRPISDFTQVLFEVNPVGMAHPQPSVSYTDSGVAIVSLRADTIAGSVEVIAIANGDTGTTTIRLNPGPASRIIAYSGGDTIPGLDIIDTIYADGFSSVAIACTVFDRFSNPVLPGSPVSFQTTRGSVSPSGYTNVHGYAFSRLTAGTDYGDALVTVRSGDAIEFVDVYFDSLVADEIVVNVFPTSLPGDGASSADITAYVYAGGLPVSDGTRVYFDNDTATGMVRGIITPRIAYTVGGQATATITAPTDVGDGAVIASLGPTLADTAGLVYVPGDPATIEFDTTLSDSLPADGSGYDVVVRVYDAYHNPVAIGTEVTFESSIGTILSPSVVDSDSGTARTIISSTVTGNAFVTARSGSAVRSRAYYFYPLEADIIDLVANPIRITADGVSTSNLIATVLDTTGGVRPVSDNTPVFFESRGGGIVNPRTAYTEDGQVTATLIAGIVTGMDTIIATVGAGISDTAVVELVAGPPSIVDFVDPIRDMYADGLDTQTVWAEVTDAYGNAVTPGLPVNFDISLGYITPSGATNDSGFAMAVIVSGTSFGTASLSATCGGASGYATLNFIPYEAESLVLVADPPVLTANGSDASELTAVVFDSSGLPVSDGTMVRFGTSAGIVTPAVSYTSGGVATSTLFAGTSPADSVIVTARAGTLAVDTTYCRFIPGPPAVMYITASDSSIIANGADTTRIFVEVFDEFGNPVEPGEEVTFNSSLGTITSTAYTDSDGRANVRLISGIESGFSNVEAVCGDAEASILIEFISTEVGQILLTVIPSILTADGSSTANVNVIVLDSIGNPVSDGTTVRFSGLSLGGVSPIFTTTTGGEANAVVTSYTDVGWDTLVVTSGDSTAEQAILFEAGPPAYVWLYPRDSTLMANESDTTRIFGQVTDESGNNVRAGLVVNFDISPAGYGTIWGVDATDDSGRVDVPFRAGRFGGVAIISANCEGATGITQVELVPTIAADISLSIIDRYLPADGVSSASVTAYVTDSSGMEISDGVGVRFGQDTVAGNVTGILNPNWETTIDGNATVDLFAPTVAGSTFVYAFVPRPTAGDTIMSDTVAVYFQPGNIAVVRFDTNYVQLYANGEDTLADSLWVEDAFGNGVVGATVQLDIGTGSVTPPIGVSGASGGMRFRLTAPTRVGSEYLTATSSGVSGYLPVDYIPTAVDTIILSISPRGLPADGSSTANVRATVLDSLGNPVSDGVMVRFIAQMGLITPMDSLVSGQASAILVAADTSGVDTIYAICQGDTAIGTVNYEAGPPDDITLNVIPDTATVGSSRTSEVSGIVTDPSGNPVATGTYVYLTVDSVGTGSVADPVVATDDSGAFYTLYTPGLKAGLTGITASVGGLTAHSDILLKAGPPHTMDLSVSRDFIYIRGVGEVDQSIIQAVIYDEYDNPVRDSSAVVFRIVVYPAGSINPELIPNHPSLPLYSDTVYTIGGSASVTLRSGDNSGSIVVEARAILPGGGVLDSRAPRITVGSGLPFNVSVSANECNVRGWDIDGVPNGVMAIITDRYENPVAPGTAVWFTVNEGAITTSATTNDTGFAYATWYSSDPRDSGLVWVIAETRDSLEIRADTTVFYNSGPAVGMDMSLSPGITFADTSGHSNILIDVWDINENPVVDGVGVMVTTDWGSVESPVQTTDECYGSYAESRYTGRNLTRDYYCGADTGGSATIEASIGGVGDSEILYLRHDLPNTGASYIIAPANVPYGFPFGVSVKIVDQWNNPICGEDITLSGSNVTVTSAPVQTTGATGEASWDCQAPDTTEPSIGVIIATINSTGGTLNQSVTYSTRRRPAPEPEADAEEPITPWDRTRSELYLKEK